MQLPPLHEGVLIRRYKRFLADVRLLDGREVVAHCPNPGSMESCAFPGGRVWLSHSVGGRRKLSWTWEVAEDEAGERILIHTGRANGIVAEGLRAGQIPALSGYDGVQAEVRYGTEGSRVDFVLTDSVGQRPPCFVEVKSVTLKVGEGQGAFPDAVTTRGRRHLRDLMGQVVAGRRAVLLFLVSREGLTSVRPADEVDPAYGQTLREARAAGVEVLAHRVAFVGGGAPAAVVLEGQRPVSVLVSVSAGISEGMVPVRR